MYRLLIYALLLLITGGGTFVASKLQLRKERRHHQRTLAAARDSIAAYADSNQVLRANVRFLVSQDSLKSELLAQNQRTLYKLSRDKARLVSDSTSLANEVAAMADGVITDSVTVIKRFLRKPKVTRVRK